MGRELGWWPVGSAGSDDLVWAGADWRSRVPNLRLDRRVAQAEHVFLGCMSVEAQIDEGTYDLFVRLGGSGSLKHESRWVE